MTVEIDLFLTFAYINVMSLGGVFGVLPEMERLVVTEHHWITHDQFIQAWALGGFVPGPNMAMCPLIGFWVAGWSGWLAAVLGIYAPTFIFMGVARWLFSSYRDVLWVQRTETSLRPLVFGLLAGAALRYLWTEGDMQITRIAVPDKVSPIVSRLPSLGLGVIGMTLLLRGKVGITSLIFIGGASWCLVSFFV